MKEIEKDGFQDFARELKKLWHMKVSVIPFAIGALGAITKGLVKDLEDLEIRGWVNNSIIKIDQNTEKSPENYNNNNCRLMDFKVPADQSENKRKRKDRWILGSYKKTKKAVEHEGDGNTNFSWCARDGP